MTQTSRDRAIGTLVGLAVGDAVGTTLEFKRPGTFEPIDDLVGGGPFRLEPGQWTDDTSMAMCLAESILQTGGLDPADQLRRYVDWQTNGYWSSKGTCFDIGGATARALLRFERTGAVTDKTVDQEAAANGSLMRLASVPIRWHTDIAEAAARAGESSLTTHPADRPIDACRAFGAMIAALIQGAAFEDMMDPRFWQFGPLDPEIEQVIRGSRDKEPPAIRGTGFVVDALEAALWAVAGARDFRDAVLRAANLGDDADTTAAIAGQLAGARWGVSGIPESWRSKTVRCDEIARIAGELHDAAIERPTTPRPWAHDKVIHGYWAEPGRILAGEYPGDPLKEKALRKINLLVDEGVRTFVDLTNGDPLRPYSSLVEAIAQERGLELHHVAHPIPDMGVTDDAGYDEILVTIEDGAERGVVYVHCWGGIGRTATVVGCLFVDRGLSPDDALARIDDLRSVTRKAHMAAPQNRAQIDLVRNRTPGGSPA